MCGIAGYCLNPKEHQRASVADLAGQMLLDIEHRGQHATGSAWINPANGNRVILKAAIPATKFVQYNKEVVEGADRRGHDLKKKLETTVANRITKIRTDLSRFMDNNELLRYEVFAASGENIRFQVAGGEKSNRIPATAIPKSKSLQWDFDGEYWEDEIGHYRSSLKNNCPITGDGARRSQASLEGK
jgi:hypothetical protein